MRRIVLFAASAVVNPNATISHRCTSSSSKEWKPWDTSFTTVVKSMSSFPVAPVPFVQVENLVKRTKRERATFIQGSPSCGKSSLLRQIEKGALGTYAEVCVLDTTVHPRKNIDMMAIKVQMLRETEAEDSCLFLVDEAQSQILDRIIDPSTMFKDGFHVMYFGTTTRTTTDFKTPAELMDHKFWMHGPTLDRNLIRAYAVRVLKHHGADDAEASRLAEQAFDYVGASMGMLVKLLEAIVKSNGMLPTPNALLLNYQPRVVVNGSAAWENNSAKIAMARELLAVGVVQEDVAKWDAAKKDLLRRGIFCPVRNLDSRDAIVPWKDATAAVGWAHSWQPTFCRIHKPRIEPLPIEWNVKAPLASPIDALLRFLPAFNVETLVPQLVHGVSSRKPTEYDFQSQFREAIRNAIPEATVKPEAHTTSPEGNTVRLDFFVQPNPAKENEWWGFELLVRGTATTLSEHISRFKARGKYINLSCCDYLVLDCKTEPLSSSPSSIKNVATISPHQAEGWNIIVLDYLGKRVNIWRDGVPRYVTSWKQPKVKVAVKLHDPGHNVVLHFGKGKPTKTVRVPLRLNEKRDIGYIKYWLPRNVNELSDEDETDLKIYASADRSTPELHKKQVVVDPTQNPTDNHYHCFV